MPLASIIIPCYEQGRFLPDAVRSALSQTVPDVEVIVIDDGSSEDVLSGLGPLAEDGRVTLIRQENRGLPLSRNRGLELSHGRYVSFLDSDDWLAPTFIEQLSKALQKDDRVGMAYCDVKEVFEGQGRHMEREGSYSVGRSRTVTSGDILGSLLCGGYFPPNAVLVPREVLEKAGGFAADLGGHTDYDLWLRISAMNYRAEFVEVRLAFYRIHGSNMSFRKRHMEETRRKALQRLFERFPVRAAEALDEVIRLAAEQYSANQMLHTEFIRLDREYREADRRLDEEQKRGAQAYSESQAWIAAIEEAKAWHEGQAQNWKEAAEYRASVIEAQALRIDELERRNAGLQGELEVLRAGGDAD